MLGYQFWQRYYSGDPAVVGRTIQLVRKDYQIVGVMPPRFRWREADIYVPLKVRIDPNIYYGVTLKIRPGTTATEANAELQPILQEFAKQAPGRYPDAFKVNLRSIIEMYARPMGPKLYLLLGAVTSLLLIGCANVSILLLVRGVASATGTRRSRGPWRRARSNRAAAVDGGAGDRRHRRGARRVDRLERARADRRLAAHQLVRRRIGDRDEHAGPVVQHGPGLRDRNRVRHLAGAPALSPRSRPRGAGQRSPGDRQRAGQTDPSCDGRRPGRADAADADCGRRGRKGIPAIGERGSRIRPARTRCRCRSPSTTVPTRRGRSVPSTSSSSDRQSPRCRRSYRPAFRPTRRRRRTEATHRIEILDSSALEKPVAAVEFRQLRVFPAAAHSNRARPSLESRRDRARRGPGGDQSDDGAGSTGRRATPSAARSRSRT